MVISNSLAKLQRIVIVGDVIPVPFFKFRTMFKKKIRYVIGAIGFTFFDTGRTSPPDIHVRLTMLLEQLVRLKFLAGCGCKNVNNLVSTIQDYVVRSMCQI